MASEIVLSSLSRYKDTSVYAGDRGPEFGLMEAPLEFLTATENYKQHRVQQHEVGFLDMLAARYFGQGNEQLWWAIALANNMSDPEIEMFSGQVLVIPPRERVTAFVSRLGNG